MIRDDRDYFYGIPFSYVFTFLAGYGWGTLLYEFAWVLPFAIVVCIVVAVASRRERKRADAAIQRAQGRVALRETRRDAQ